MVDLGSFGKSHILLNLRLRHVICPGLILLVFLAPLLRGLFFQADALPYQIAAGLVLFAGALDVSMRGEFAIEGALPQGFLWMIVAYGISCFGAASVSDAIRGFLRQILYFAIFWLSWYASCSKRVRKAVLVTVFLSGSAVAVIGIIAATGIQIFPGAVLGGRIMSTFQYPNALAAYMMLTSVLGLTLLVLEEGPLLRAAYAVSVFGQVLVFLASYSRGGWVVYPLALCAMLVGLPREHKPRFLFSVCTALTSVLLIVGQFSLAAGQAESRTALKWVVLGAVISLAAEIAYCMYKKVYRSMISTSVRKALTWAVLGYGIITFLIYSVILISRYGTDMVDLLPPAVIRRFATISFEDRSFLARTLATRDALSVFTRRPLFGGGAGAWNAWYHQFQSVLYWTTEVHNHFAQVLVETGLFGFCGYMYLWGALVYCVFRFLRRETSYGEKALAWGLLVSCATMGAHSSVDFELSLPGIACQLWAVFGVTWATVGGDRIEVSSGEGMSGMRRLLRVAAAWLVAGLALCLIIPSYSFHRAAWYGRLGASALVRDDYYLAVELYDRARKYDIFTSGYAFDMGQAYAAQAVLGGGPGLKEKALSQLEIARSLAPCNIAQGVREVELLIALGEAQGAWEASRNLVRLLPLDIGTWEMLARTGVVYSLSCMRQGTVEGNEEIDSGNVVACLVEVTEIPEELSKLKDRISDTSKSRWGPERLDLTPGLKKHIGQTHYLLGEFDKAVLYLDEAIKDRSHREESSAWLLASQILTGEKQPGPALDEQVQRILTYYKLAAR